jgi:hypothetical protein
LHDKTSLSNKIIKFYHNIYSITIYNKHFSCHAVTSSTAVTTLLLVAGVGVKRRADRRGGTVHVAASVLCELRKLPL